MHPDTRRTLTFTFLLCLICATILSLLASSLREPQEKARLLDRNRQLLLATRLLQNNSPLSGDQILALYADKIRPMLTNDAGDALTFEEAQLNYAAYLDAHQKSGYASLPYKLYYQILPADGVVIPINGFGLWDAIYGYLALQQDGKTVLGTTWYQQAETAGLGANIALPEWQAQFPGKQIGPLGLTVVKGKVADLYPPDSPKARTSVDGISGATLTCKGVTDAYRECLAPYHNLLRRIADGQTAP